ncbi:MAG: AAA family ATPase [Dermatophilaceae bacterium]|nr:AAA family ATPase [Dermatophilaceae bacterium]
MSAGLELDRERAYLVSARAELARMREQTLSLKADGGDRVSSENLAAALHRRAQSLIDDPGTNLFFGRIDQQSDHCRVPDRWYIGRRHVADSHGDPVVIDWRADVSTAFYRASPAEPMGVSLRRRFGVDRGRLTAYEDERLDGDAAGTGSGGLAFTSQILVGEIERPRVGPMRDIVATIQPEQDAIVRSDVGCTICIQGAPGTGKTAVGLHRAAWLLYAFRERLARSGVLVIGPNRAFLDHIGAVLPTLGEVEVRHTTIDELLASVPVRGRDSVETAVLKGDPRLAAVLRAAVWACVQTPTEPLVLPRGAHKWRVPASEVAEIVQELRTRGVRYDAARRMLPHRLAHALLLQMEQAGDCPDDRVQDAVARSTAVKRYAGRVWPALDPKAVLFDLFSDAATLRRHTADLLSDAERSMLLWANPASRRGSARWSAADTVLFDEINDHLQRIPSLGHVVLDEAQDLSPMQLRAVGRRCSTGSATVLGDLAQGTTPWATDSWMASLRHLGKPDAVIETLERGFRVPASVIDYAARLLPSMAPGLGVPVAVRDNPGRLEVVQVEGPLLYDRVAGSVAETLREPGSVGVIVPDSAVAAVSEALSRRDIDHGVLGTDHGDVDHQVDVIPATVAKGLEFDRVIVVEPAAIAAAEPDRRTGLRRLYVVLTRAVSELTVLHSAELPAELAG